jgi:hypothetical protein
VVLRELCLLKGEAAFDLLCESWEMMVKYQNVMNLLTTERQMLAA